MKSLYIAISVFIFYAYAPVYAQQLTLDAEIVDIPNVGTSWQTVSLLNTYTSPVVVCTYNHPSTTAVTGVTPWVRNAGSNSFQLRLARMGSEGDAVSISNVYCFIVEEGAHNIGGQNIEAYTVISDQTVQNDSGWPTTLMENVTSTLTQSYSNIAVFGQVMSDNSVPVTAFFVTSCATARAIATPSSLCVGKHRGQISSTPGIVSETLGYIVAEVGSGVSNDIRLNFAQSGGGNVSGITSNGAPFSVTISGDNDLGLATMATINGPDGGWAVLLGADPLPNGSIDLAISEETFSDGETNHTAENVFIANFENNQAVNIETQKTVSMFAGSPSIFAVPGSEQVYTLDIENTGALPIDNNSLFLAIPVPSESQFYNADMDDGGPATGPIFFTETGSGLTFDDNTDLAFSDQAGQPASFSACTYSSISGYDANIRYICLNPKGRLNGGGFSESSFVVQYRTMLR